ncbi:MAG: ABC transporter permease [Chloroflexi bacterium]|nr:ABC transporter permease [Chloroflexota bacterium]
MGAYLIKRLLQLIPVLILASILIFVILHSIPGDPALVYAGPDATPETLAAVRADMGLDQPWPVQYLVWAEHIVRLDFGQSYTSKYPVGELISQRVPATLELALSAVLLEIVIGISFGLMAALYQRRWPDFVVSAYCAIVMSVPNFWLGILLIIFFALQLGWLPPGNRVEFLSNPGVAWKSLIMPAFTLALFASATVARFTRASMLEVLGEDYIRTARAKGLRERVVITSHALRNALIPVITIVGIQFGYMLGGAVVVESVFTWPGMGRLIMQGISSRDYTVVQGSLILFVAVFVLLNLIIDISYAFFDPRIRLGGKKAS